MICGDMLIFRDMFNSHLKNYKLSMLDQLVPPMLVPLVLYFPSPSCRRPSQKSTTHLLKNSLSLLLTRFYPLAGRTNDDGVSIHCNDQGIPFVVANIKRHKLSDLLKNPDPNLPQSLLPCVVGWDTVVAPGSSVVTIQVNYFDCGGMAIGAVFSHKIVDGIAIGKFISSWACTARNLSEPVCPNYIAQYLFPQKHELGNQSGSLGPLMKTGKSVTRRYIFNALAISKLKADTNVERPTRVEVVSALIWKCFMVASLANDYKVSLLTHAVNLRRRAHPPFSSDCFGNFPGLAAATTTNRNEHDLGHFVRKMRDAVSKLDGDFVNRLYGDEGFLGYQENLGRVWSEVPEGADLLSISSWCGFSLYGVDFGWGKPVWITRNDSGNDSETKPFMNVVWLMDTRDGNGVEAWVILDEKYMKIFDNVDELKDVALRDPSPLDVGAH